MFVKLGLWNSAALPTAPEAKSYCVIPNESEESGSEAAPSRWRDGGCMSRYTVIGSPQSPLVLRQ